MPDLSTLVSDIYKLFDEKEHHEINEGNIDAFGENLKAIIRTRLAKRPIEERPLRFSSLGKPDRQIWLDSKTEDRPFSKTADGLKFLYGDVIEALLVFLVKEAGHDVQDEQREISVDGVKGHLDCTIDGVVVDVKSAAPYSYKKFIEGSFYTDVFSKRYLDQLCGYSNVITPGVGPAFLVMDKSSGDISVIPVSISIAQDFQPDVRIEHLKAVLTKDEMPPLCYPDKVDGKSGNRVLDTGCSFCNHKKGCWPSLRAFKYSNGVKYLTSVVRTPDVPEVPL